MSKAKPDLEDLSSIESFSSWPYALSDISGKLLATASLAGMAIAGAGLLQATGVLPDAVHLSSDVAQIVGQNWVHFGVSAGLGWGSFFGGGIAGWLSSKLSNIDNKAAAAGKFRPLEAFNNAVYSKKEDQFMAVMNKKYANVGKPPITLEDLGSLCAMPDYKLGKLPLVLQTVIMKTQRDMYYSFLDQYENGLPKNISEPKNNATVQDAYELYRGQRNSAGEKVKRQMQEEGFKSSGSEFNGLEATGSFVAGVMDSGVKPLSGTAMLLDIVDDGSLDFSFQTKQAEAQLVIIGIGLFIAASVGSIYASGKGLIDAFLTKNPERHTMDANDMRLKNVTGDIKDAYATLKGKVAPLTVPGIA